MDLLVVGVNSMAWELFDFGNNRVPRDEYTDATVRFIKMMQTPEGNWRSFEGRRPPMTAGTYQTAALAIYSLKTYAPPSEKADTDKIIARAAAWLEAEKPVKTQDRAFQLMGLAWANAKPAAIATPQRPSSLHNARMADGISCRRWDRMRIQPGRLCTR